MLLFSSKNCRLNCYRLCFSLCIFLFLIVGCKKKLPDYVEIPYNEILGEIDFNIDVKPILSDKCFLCHGPDARTRKADLRFDIEGGLFKKSNQGNLAFKAGNLDKSEGIQRILSDDPNYIMPPADSHLELTPKEKAILVKWVEQGASWKKHWAFIPPVKETPPIIKTNWEVKNEIDQFVYSKLIENGLSPSERTTKEQLLRRITIDLTGMVPTTEELNAFLNDKSPNAYEKVVNRLLETDEHAERLAIEWLDLARYSDSHGYHADGSRYMWPWRDWVLHAFKNNMPYDEFVSEQIAGDLMPNPTKKQILATAFNRNHPTTAEGGAIDEEFRVEYVSNRTNTFGTAFLGMTMECAKCHDHKFDPISQKDYFELFAFFNNIKELGMTANDKNAGPFLLLSDSITDKKIKLYIAKIDSLENIQNKEKQLFMADVNYKDSKYFKIKSPILRHTFEKLKKTKKHIALDGQNKTIASNGITLEQGMLGLGAKFNDQYDQINITNLKAFEITTPFSISVWVLQEQNVSVGKTMTIIGNSSVKSQFYRGWDLFIEPSGKISSRLISSMPSNYIHIKTKDVLPIGKWTHVLMTYDGSAKASGLNLYIDGKTAKTKIEYDRLYKSMINREKGRILVGKSPRGQTGDNGVFIGMIDQLSIFDSEILPLQVSHVYNQSKTNTPTHIWVPSEKNYLILNSKLKDLQNEKLETIDTIKEIMVMEEMPKQRNTFVLERGAYDVYGEKVERGTPENIMEFFPEYPKNRLGLAQWLFDKKNPLAARVAVNRYWQMIYGTGLVSTPNDFGNQGAMPTHPKLLDWLAVDFMESGWDLRKLLKTMVSSYTYMQVSKASLELRELDPENKLLARAPSYRWQAEFIRNNVLKSSGLLNEKFGGESVKPYQPEGLWIEKGNFSADLLRYKQDHDNKQYRNSLYTFHKRTSPPPFMTTFDMPGRDFCAVSRERTNTPLQALSLLNDPQFVEASKALAVRMKMQGGDSIKNQIETGFQMAISRKPNATELGILIDLYSEEFEVFKNNKAGAKEYLEVGDYRVPEDMNTSELAAMTMVANTIYNLDEMYTKR